ncbi:MAG: ABC transporter ATP-binding protein/permease [Hydrogenibacillus schlegelii]|uniref:ABC transporter ATP-binding protein/permease n=1 Tax=Hydrogenibacillus schlegelii TaxID=1484 RepID=A0A947D219_HYDSH|nr:ABC transporter ATP-binding protein/permease [Hydrogenibacillus schlegelii]
MDGGKRDAADERVEYGVRRARRVGRRLLRYAGREWRLFLVGFAFLFLATAGNVLGPALIRRFIDRHLVPGDFAPKPLLLLAAAYLLSLVLTAVFQFLQYVAFGKAAQRIVLRIRMDVYRRATGFAMAFYDRVPSGWLVSRVTNDTEALKELYATVIAAFVQNGVFLLGVTGALFILDPRSALWLVWVLPAAFGLMVAYRRLSDGVVRAVRKTLSALSGFLGEALAGMRVIQAYRQEGRFQERFEALTATAYGAQLRRIRLNALLVRPAVDVLYLLALVVLVDVFGLRSLTGAVSLGVLVAFIAYVDRMFEPVNEMMFSLTFLQGALVAGERVFGLLDHEEPFFKPERPAPGGIREGRIEFRDVSFAYDPAHPVLDGVTFTVEPGQTVALVGPTGAGKSTIAGLILRFYRPTAGEIRIDGRPLDDYDEAVLRRDVGYVLQEPFLFGGDVAFNIRLYEDVPEEAVAQAAAFVGLDRRLARLPEGLRTPVMERGAALSAGERQLVAFARVMLRNPKILILDEATASVDSETEALIEEALARMRRDRTTIIIAHRLSTIQKADRIFVLSRGRIVEAGTHETLMAKGGLYATMVRLQTEGEADFG